MCVKNAWHLYQFCNLYDAEKPFYSIQWQNVVYIFWRVYMHIGIKFVHKIALLPRRYRQAQMSRADASRHKACVSNTATDNNLILWTALISGGSKGAHVTPPVSKFFQFHAVFGNICQNGMLAPPPPRVGAPPRGNYGSATVDVTPYSLKNANIYIKMTFCRCVVQKNFQ